MSEKEIKNQKKELDIDMELFKTLPITEELYNLVKNYEKEPLKYKKELMAYLIKNTTKNTDLIKKLSNNYKNTNILKEYVGEQKNFNETFFENLVSSDYDFYIKLYVDMLVSKNTSIGLKRLIVNAIPYSMEYAYRWHKNPSSNSQLKYCYDFFKQNFEIYLKHENIDLNEANLILDYGNYIDNIYLKYLNLEKPSFDLFFNGILKSLIEKIQNNKNDFDLNNEKHKNIAIAIREFILKYIEKVHHLRDKNINQEEVERKENIYMAFFENKEKQLGWLNILFWFANNLLDKEREYSSTLAFGVDDLVKIISHMKPENMFLDHKLLLQFSGTPFEDINIFKEACSQSTYMGRGSNQTLQSQLKYQFVPLFKYFKNSIYDKISKEELFKKAHKQVDDLSFVSKEIEKLQYEEKSKILRTTSGIGASSNISKEKAPFLYNKDNYIGSNPDYNSWHCEKDTMDIINTNPKETKQILEKLLKNFIHYELIGLLHNEGNMSQKPLVKQIYLTLTNSFTTYKDYSKTLLNFLLEDNQKLFNALDLDRQKLVLPFIVEHLLNDNNINQKNLMPFVELFKKLYGNIDFYKFLISQKKERDIPIEKNLILETLIEKNISKNNMALQDFYGFVKPIDSNTYNYNSPYNKFSFKTLISNTEILEYLLKEQHINNETLFEIIQSNITLSFKELLSLFTQLCNKDTTYFFKVFKLFHQEMLKDSKWEEHIRTFFRGITKINNEEHINFFKTIKGTEKQTLFIGNLIHNFVERTKEKNIELLPLKEKIISKEMSKEIFDFLQNNINDIFNINININVNDGKKDKKIIQKAKITKQQN